MIKIYRLLYNINIVYYLIISVSLALSMSFIVGFLLNIIHIENTFSNYKISKLEFKYIIALTVFVIPIVETLVFQVFMFWILKNISPALKNIIISILFAANHYYTIKQIIFSFFLCCLFNFSYMYSLKRKWNSFLVVTLIHSSYNFIVSMVYYSIRN